MWCSRSRLLFSALLFSLAWYFPHFCELRKHLISHSNLLIIVMPSECATNKRKRKRKTINCKYELKRTPHSSSSTRPQFGALACCALVWVPSTRDMELLQGVQRRAPGCCRDWSPSVPRGAGPVQSPGSSPCPSGSTAGPVMLWLCGQAAHQSILFPITFDALVYFKPILLYVGHLSFDPLG